MHLDNFEGPFDLLLQLISKHKLDITEVALSQVTDEFIAHIKAMGSDWELEQTTQFLVVAATLLDLKIVRLLPSAEIEDEDDLALLEARDLLFARLLQYRAFKQVAAVIETADGGGVAAGATLGGARRAVRGRAARRADHDRAGRVRPAGRRGPGAQGGADPGARATCMRPR